jgi:methionyl-tRNA synthetase
MGGYALHAAAAAVFDLVDATNGFIAETAPWSLARTPETAARLDQVLADVVEAVRVAGVLLLPIMPASAAEILRRMGEHRPAADLRLDADTRWSTARERQIAKAEPMWPRLDEKGAASPRDKEKQTMTSDPSGAGAGTPPTQGAAAPAAPAGPAPGTPAEATSDARVSIDDFMHIELRVARVLAAERVPKSKKLVKMQIDIGTEQRTIVAGIAEAYAPEALVGRTIVVVANLKPAKLMGIESNGMVLAASPEGGLPVLVALEQPLPPGTRVR